MSWVNDTALGILDPGNLAGGLSGETAAKGTAASIAAQERAAEIQRQQTERARQEVMALYPIAQQNLLGGYQGAMDVYKDMLPAQMRAFQQGNIGAQNVLSGALPQQANAILGGPVDYSFMQPQQVPAMGRFVNMLDNVPNMQNMYATSEQALADVNKPQPEQPTGLFSGGDYYGRLLGGTGSYNQW